MAKNPFSHPEIHSKIREANAIQRLKARLVAWVRRLQQELYEAPGQTIEGVSPSNWPTALLPIRPFAQTGTHDVSGAQGHPAPGGTENSEANSPSAGECGISAGSEQSATVANAKTQKRRRELIKLYRTKHDLTMANLARHSATSVTAIQGMVRGDRTRYGEETLLRFLKTIGASPEQW